MPLTYTAAGFLLTAVVALLFSSCTSSSESERDDLSAGIEMRFNASAQDTRATLTTNSSLTDFNVWGAYRALAGSEWAANPAIAFNGVTVKKQQDASWTYDNIQYWSPSCRYTFLALNPISVNATFIPGTDFNSDMLKVTNFNAITGGDLVAASHSCVSIQQSNPVVSLTFRHLLSRIEISAKKDGEVTDNLTITGVKITGLNTVGTWTSEGMESPSPYGKWSALSGTDGTYSMSDLNIELTASPTPLLTGDNSVLVIPQAIPAGAKAIIEYTENDSPKKITADIYRASLGVTGSFAAARVYRFNLSIGLDEYILFEVPSIQGWEDAEGGNYLPQ